MVNTKAKTKVPVLTDRITDFVGVVAATKDANGDFDGKEISVLWDAEVRYHFENGRTEKTTELYINKYRKALKEAFGEKSTPVAICNMRKLRDRLKSYIDAADLPQSGVAASIEERIERAEENIVGRKPTLLLQISSFIEALNDVSDKAGMQVLWQSELKVHDGKALTTIISYVTRYRNAIREAFGEEHPMMKIAAGDPAMYDEARKRKMATIAVKHGSLITFENYKEVVRICTDLLKSEKPMEVAIGLIGTTGRRPFEVFTRAEFSPAPYAKGVSKWSVLFKGQAKTKEREGTKFGMTYEIPTLAPATLVLDAYQRLRASSQGKLWLQMKLNDFSDDARLPLRDAVIELFGKLWPKEEDPKPYGLRHLYAEIAYHNFAPKTVSKNSYFAAILGHNNNDLETSLSYMTYTLPEEVGESLVRAERVADRTTHRLESV